MCPEQSAQNPNSFANYETCEQCLQFGREYFKGEFEHVLEVMLSICRSHRKLDVKSEEGDVDSSKASKVLANVIQEVSEQIGQEVEQGSRTTCERCGVTFASTHSLIRHLKAIKPCPITISNNSRGDHRKQASTAQA